MTVKPDEKQIPGLILAKVVNRRRRLLWWAQQQGPEVFVERERELLDRAVDELCAWAEEHAPELFYRDKGGEDGPAG